MCIRDRDAAGIQPIFWGCQSEDTDVPDLSGFSDAGVANQPVQSGLLNSSLLDCGQGTAAQVALDYSTSSPEGDFFADWYLPSIAELLLIRQGTATSAGFASTVLIEAQSAAAATAIEDLSLWSSTEHTSDLVWVLRTPGANGGNGGLPVGIPSKGAMGNSVLPIRSF